MFVYETAAFCEEVDRHNLRDVVDRFNSRLAECKTRVEVSARTIPRWPWYLMKPGNFRLIGGIETIGQHDVFCWFRVMTRGGHEYTPFRDLSSDQIKREFSFNNLSEWFAAKEHEERVANAPQPLPHDLYSWFEALHEIAGGLLEEGSNIILESPLWRQDIEQFLDIDKVGFYRAVSDLAQDLEPSDSILEVREFRNTNGAIVDACRVDARTWYLLRPRHETRPGSSAELDVPESREEAFRSAQRAYPDWVLADMELWLEIQDEAAANLALSVEESNLLAGVAGDGVTAHTLPLFINGQAGSGKSTMLAFIFAALCKKKVDQELRGDPLYITYSGKLISRAKEATMRILRTGFGERGNYSSLDLDKYMMTWQEYLLSLLPSDEDRFLPEKRVDFGAFRRYVEGPDGGLLGRYHGARLQESAETLWFVIRSIIKGSETVEDLSPDDYEQEFSKRDQIVTPDGYRRIFEFYETHYKSRMSERELWDDQDLVRAVLRAEKSGQFDREVTALVIDEAQDFTRCELRLVTRTLVYSRYGPPAGNAFKTPVIFAGDPLQTLSPTGFKWEKIKGGLHEELRNVIGDRAADTTFQELRNNYRSLKPIVDFANSVQLWRREMFGLDVVAQGAWNPNINHEAPARFLVEEHSIEDLENFLRETPIIVNCEDGEEVSYVRTDPVLNKVFPDASDDDLPAFVFSSAAVKGLEFPKVVLYKFGETDAEIRWQDYDETTLALEAEYFFNKLYVGVTRATKNLYVLDSRDGIEKVWTRFDNAPLRALSDRHPDFFRVPDIEGVVTGEIGHIDEGFDLAGREEENPEQNARSLMQFGIETRDARHLRRAQSYFRRVRNEAMAKTCEAHALQFDGNYLEAARLFKENSQWKEAWDCAWSGGGWSELSDILTSSTRAFPVLQEQAVRFMSTKNAGVVDCLDLLVALKESNESEVFPRITDRTWTVVVTELTRLLKSDVLVKEREVSDELVRAAEGMDLLGLSGFTGAADVAGDLFSAGGDLVRALQAWERAGDRARIKVARAKARRDGLPAGLVHLQSAELWEEIVGEWDDHEQPLEPDWLEAVTDALRSTRQFREGFEKLVDAGAFDKAIDFLFLIDPSLEQSGDRSALLAKRMGSTFDVGGVLVLLDRMRSGLEDGVDKSARLRPVYIEAVVSIVTQHHADGWEKDAAAPWLQSFRMIISGGSGVGSWTPEVRSEAFRNRLLLLGAGFELVEEWQRASVVYLDIVGGSRRPLEQRLARERWLHCQWRLQLEESEKERQGYSRGVNSAAVRKARLDKAAVWQFTERQLEKINKQPKPYLSEADAAVVELHQRGEYVVGGISFEFRVRNQPDEVVEVTARVGDDGEICTVKLADRRARFRMKDIDSDGDVLTIAAPEWSGAFVQVEFGEVDEIVFIDSDGESERFAVRDNSQRRRRQSARVTDRAPRTIKVYELAEELNVSMDVMKRLLREAGIQGRRNGNDRLNEEQANAVRAAHRRREN